MLRIIFCVLLSLITFTGICKSTLPAKTVKQIAVIKTDSSAIIIREYNSKNLKIYARQPEFQYNEDAATPSLWTRFWRWFRHLFDFFRLNIHPSGGFIQVVLFCLKYLVIILGVSAVVFFILKLIGVDVSGIFNRKSRSVGLPYSESLENIHEIDFDAEIEKAIGQHNYRLAVRLLYLKCLKQLNDASLINWQPEKTNNAYINELANSSQLDSFKSLTRQFEYVWYGEFAINGDIFKNINSRFQQFKIKQG